MQIIFYYERNDAGQEVLAVPGIKIESSLSTAANAARENCYQGQFSSFEIVEV